MEGCTSEHYKKHQRKPHTETHKNPPQKKKIELWNTRDTANHLSKVKASPHLLVKLFQSHTIFISIAAECRLALPHSHTITFQLFTPHKTQEHVVLMWTEVTRIVSPEVQRGTFTHSSDLHRPTCLLPATTVSVKGRKERGWLNLFPCEAWIGKKTWPCCHWEQTQGMGQT